MATFAAAHLMKEKHARSLLGMQGIHGVGVGFLDPGKPNKGAAVIIYSDRLASTALAALPQLTLRHKGAVMNIPVRYVNTGKFRSHKANYTRKIRPIPPGYSIGTTSGSGTAGLIVNRRSGQAQRFILSNNHVLNPHNASVYQATLQPGGADGGKAADRVGRLYQFVQLKAKQNNYLDAAISVPIRNSLLNPRYPTVGVLPGHASSYSIGERFIKVGRTTGRVSGTVESIHTDLQIDYGGSLGVLTFKNQSVIRGKTPVSLPGDSGSIWLSRRNHYAAAVNFAGSSDGRLSISYPVQWAMQVFRTRVAQPAGAGRVLKAGRASSNRTRRLTAKELARLRIVRAHAQES